MHFRPLLAASHVAIVVAGPKPSAFGACEGAWDVFRGKLEASAAGGFPEDAELAQLAEAGEWRWSGATSDLRLELG